MNLKMLEAKRLSKEELRTIEAGFAPPDCDAGHIRYIPGAGYVCTSSGSCTWEWTAPIN